MSATSRRHLLAGGIFSLPGLSAAVQAAASPYRRPKLKITAVRTAYVAGHGRQLHVRVDTDQGLTGQGEATDAAIGGAAIIAGWRRFLTHLLQLATQAGRNLLIRHRSMSASAKS